MGIGHSTVEGPTGALQGDGDGRAKDEEDDDDRVRSICDVVAGAYRSRRRP